MPEIPYNASGSKTAAFPPEPLSRVYLLTGSDDALKHEALTRLRAAALDPGFADFDQETVDLTAGSGEEGTDPVARILEAANSAPFASPRKVVTVVSAQRLPKERQEALAENLARLGALSLLILVADAVEMEAGKPKGKQIENALKKAVAIVGAIVVCDSMQGSDLKTRLTAILKARGKTAGPGVVEALLARAESASSGTGGDLNTLTNEAEKLMTYVGERKEITREDADLLLPAAAEENIFRLLDAIGARDARRALDETEALLSAEEKPDGTAARTFVMVQRHLRLLSLAKYLSDNKALGRGPLPPEVKENLSGEFAGFAAGQAYRLPAYAKQAANFTWEELTLAMTRVLASDMVMKGIYPGETLAVRAPGYGDDPASNLRLLVYELCRK